MEPVDARKLLVERLGQDLVGPHSADEVIEGVRVRPSDVYLSGILWPIGERMDGGDDDGSDADEEDGDSPSTPGLVGQQRPCTMGISFATKSEIAVQQVALSLRFATYAFEEFQDKEGKKNVRWKRLPWQFDLPGLRLPTNGISTYPVEIAGLEPTIEIHVRSQGSPDGLLSTVTVINRTRTPVDDRNVIEQNTLFQVELVVRAVSPAAIIPRPRSRIHADENDPGDEDDHIGALLYRNCPDYAAGHQCSVSWEIGSSGTAVSVSTCWIPSAVVPAMSPDGHKEFHNLVPGGALDAGGLAECSDDELLRRLEMLPDAYAAWIDLQQKEVPALPAEYAPVAKQNLLRCSGVLARICAGVAALRGKENGAAEMRLAFRLANKAMAIQHSWKPAAKGPLIWYPFQLAFILLAAESACRRNSSDRETMDLLWFPTGGGKTEAYLAIVAMLAFFRRLSGQTADKGAGNAAVMRYTLRLLTAQQFERASSLMLACDLLRLRRVKPGFTVPDLGQVPFSIGLWVGGDATPNNFVDAYANRGQRNVSSAEQIETCPCCQGKVRWNYDQQAEKVNPYCENEECLLGPAYGLWPVYTVDSDVYAAAPTLLIGTVDKFALIPTREEVAQLFGFGGGLAPDLIIQDELHLISGPLGTIAGLYESAFDWLVAREGHRPKVIGSTATIRRAARQIRDLFDRTACQFPPPGLDHDDSGFAVRDKNKEGRLYLGVTTAGRSAKFALQAAVGSLLQSAGPAAIPAPEDRDGYATLLAYFNSLRELGGAIVQMLDDVPDAMKLYSTRRSEGQRQVKEPRELTSRVSQREIVQILAELSRHARDPETVDVVLATNMVSVGVDVSRLGLMVVNGQPKTRSEYIQATSRVGRSTFPGLVVSVLNAAKPRDRSHYETFPGWHERLYRDVEATSVTPFASRARDRALHAVLVAMIRHGSSLMRKRPDFAAAPEKLLQDVVAEIERRVNAVDPRELAQVQLEIDERLQDWEARAPRSYMNSHQPNKSLLQSADRYAQRKAAGRTTGAAWPTMNNMRSVEPGTRFRMAERLTSRRPGSPGAGDGTAVPAGDGTPARPAPRWRRNNA
jgi:hypothetical protein